MKKKILRRIGTFKELLEGFVSFQEADKLHRQGHTKTPSFISRVQRFMSMFSSPISAEISIRIIKYLLEKYEENTFHRIPMKRIWADYRKCSEIFSDAKKSRLILGKAIETSDRWVSLFHPKHNYLLNPFVFEKLHEETHALASIREFMLEEEPAQIADVLSSPLTYSIMRWLYDSGEGILTVSTARDILMAPESTIYSAFEALDKLEIIERPVPSVARPGPRFDETMYAMLFSEYFVTQLDRSTKSLSLRLFAFMPATVIDRIKIGKRASFNYIDETVRKELKLPIYISLTKLFRPIIVTTDEAASALNLSDLTFTRRIYGSKRFGIENIFEKMTMHKPISEDTRIGAALEKFNIVHDGIVPLNLEHLVLTDDQELKCVELELVI